MKKICLLFLLLISSTILKSQETSVEKSVFGVQTGFWGVWAYNEARLAPKWALRTEIGLFDYFGITEGINLEPVLSVEPRWYFNRAKRLEKGKRIDGNSGSFVALKTSLRPAFFSLPVLDEFEVEDNLSISFVPTIGARKNIGKKFNYELGFGFGVEYFAKGGYSFELFSSDDNENDSKVGPAFNIHLRIGYRL